MAVPFLACMAFVSQLYDLPPRVLPSIQAVEGGGIGVVHRNTDGSEDMGVMQINTTWLPTLARYSQQSIPEVRHQLLTSPCYNISAAGMVLHGYLQETGGDLMRAIGNYNSHTPIHNHVYQMKVCRRNIQTSPLCQVEMAPSPAVVPWEAGCGDHFYEQARVRSA